MTIDDVKIPNVFSVDDIILGSDKELSHREKELLYFFVTREKKAVSVRDINRELSITRTYIYYLLHRLIRLGLIEENIESEQPKSYSFHIDNIEIPIKQFQNRIEIILNFMAKNPRKLEEIVYNNLNERQKVIISFIEEKCTFKEIQKQIKESNSNLTIGERQLRREIEKLVEMKFIQKEMKKLCIWYSKMTEIQLQGIAQDMVSIYKRNIEYLLEFKTQLGTFSNRETLTKQFYAKLHPSIGKVSSNQNSNIYYDNEEIRLLRGRENIQTKLQTYFLTAKTIYLARFTPEPIFAGYDESKLETKIQKITHYLIPLIDAAITRGVFIKIMVSREALPTISNVFRNTTKAKSPTKQIEFRITSTKALSFDIFDNNVFLEYLTLSKPLCLMIRQPEAVEVKAAFFQKIWNEAEPWIDNNF